MYLVVHFKERLQRVTCCTNNFNISEWTFFQCHCLNFQSDKIKTGKKSTRPSIPAISSSSFSPMKVYQNFQLFWQQFSALVWYWQFYSLRTKNTHCSNQGKSWSEIEEINYGKSWQIFIFENNIVFYWTFKRKQVSWLLFTLNLNMAHCMTANELTTAGRLKLADFFI